VIHDPSLATAVVLECETSTDEAIRNCVRQWEGPSGDRDGLAVGSPQPTM